MKSTDRWAETTAKKRHNWLIFFLFLIGLGLRLYGYEWGFPHHFHPDERQIVDFQTPQVKLDVLNPLKSVPVLARGDLIEFRRMVDGMNTKFFAYGPLPMYTLAVTIEIQDWINSEVRSYVTGNSAFSKETKNKVKELFPRVKNGRGRIVTGRVIAAILSALTILVVFKIAYYLYNIKVAYLASAFFTFTVLSIQHGHFMVVDGPQTFLVAWAIYFLVRIAMGDHRRDYYFAGIFIGLAMATKFSTAPIGLAYILAHLLSMTRGRRRGKLNWVHWLAGGLTAIVVMSIIMPFWLIDSREFFHDITEQRNMVMGIADLPYTIQFENTTPFIYMIKQMIFWSLGLPLGLAAFIGLGASIRRIWKKPADLGNIVMISFVIPLFYFNGTFFAKFLRYTLVLTPFMVIFAARWLYEMKTWAGRGWARAATIAVLVGTIGWAAAYETIFLEPHTRLQASDWIYENVENGANIIQESGWDDGLPVSTDNGNAGKYKTRQLGIYKEPDNERRATAMADVLEWGDVIVLSSRKHYGSVSRVPNRYPISTNFYKLLYDEKIGYFHAKTFDNPPALGPLTFRDDRADESFRVYEHPKVDVFVKETLLSAERLKALLIAPPPEVADMTYDELMTRRPSTEIGSRVNFPILRWLLALEILGFICIPMAFVIFRKFEHKGYPFTKIIGLLAIAYVCWILPSLHWLAFSRTLIFAAIILFIYINHIIYQRNRDEIRAFFKERWWSVSGYDVLFLGVFCIFGLLKSFNPDIFWSESLMDFGFLNSILRADFFPPEDPWMQGQGVNYYYYGHYLAAFMTKLTGVEPHYGYNLFFITIPATIAMTLTAILIALTRSFWVGLAATVFAIFIGNLDGIPQAINIWVRQSRGTDYFPVIDKVQTVVGWVFNLGRQDAHFRFFRSAHELIRPTVHEFPFWSFNFMDLHAHTMAMMLSTFFIALQLVLLRHKKTGINLFGESSLQRVLTIGMLWVTFGAMISTNSWDVPTQFIILILVSLWITCFANKKAKTRQIYENVNFDHQYQISDTENFIDNEDTVDLEETESEGNILEETQVDLSIDLLKSIEASNDKVESDDTSPDDSEPGKPIISAENGGFFDDKLDAPDPEIPKEEIVSGIPKEEIISGIPKEETESDPSKEEDGTDLSREDSKPDISKEGEIEATKEEIQSVVAEDDHQPLLFTDIVSETNSIKNEPVEFVLEEGEEIVKCLPSIGENYVFERTGPDLWERSRARMGKMGSWLVRESIDSGLFLWKLLWPVALILLGAMFLHLPYLMTFHRAGMGIGFLWEYKQTTNLDGYFTMFGFFLFIFLTQFIKWWWYVQKERGRSELTSVVILISVIAVLFLAWVGLLDGLERGADYSVLMINVFLLFLIISIIVQGYPSTNQVFPLILAILACGIVAGCEIVFVRDFYHGSDMRRFNTIFKFYLQAWFMFAIVSAYLISRRACITGYSCNTGVHRIFRRISRWSWNIIFLILLGGSLIFTFWGVHARHNHDEYRRVDLPLTLDGWAYMKQGLRKPVVNEYRAINWLQQNIKGTPVILEASGADYLYKFGDISGNTGLPTVLGWWSHVDQREYVVRKGRGKGRRDRKVDTGKIKRDIVEMYSGADLEKVLMLFGKYHIQYVFVGPTERKEYSQLGLDKFAEMSQFMTPVYTNPDVIIYRVTDYGHAVDLTQAVNDNDALKSLRERIKAKEKEKFIAEEAALVAQEMKMMEQKPRDLFKGKQGKARGMFQEPRSLGVAPDGSVFVGDFRNRRVQKYNSEEHWVMMWGETGNKQGEFMDICDVAANSRFVYVLDTFNNRVQVYTLEGKEVRTIVPKSGSFSHPRGISADESSIYVCDTGNSRIIKFNLTGKMQGIFGRVGKGSLQFDNPIGIAVFEEEIYVADIGNCRIQVLTTNGKYVRDYAIDGWDPKVFNEPYVTVTPDGTIWYSDPNKRSVISMNQKGKILKKYTVDSRNRAFGLPMGLAVDQNGNVLVVDARNHMIQIIQLKKRALDGKAEKKKKGSIREGGRSLNSKSSLFGK
ncbi:DUF2298 domain-containing protein [bacterium]|nr:DUF2298 domain-containing protein [bacterium]